MGKIRGTALSVILVLWFAAPTPAVVAKSKPNILFIILDDLNSWVGYTGDHPQTRTPNIDKLAARGQVFTRAFASATKCAPSRTAFLSGMRPSTTGFYHNWDDFEGAIQPVQELQAQLKKHGYKTVSSGKIYHKRTGIWDETFTPPQWPRWKATASAGRVAVGEYKNKIEPRMPDSQVVTECIRHLQSKTDRPLFLACGLSKPHHPWVVPAKYFAMHPLEAIKPLPQNPDDLKDVPNYPKVAYFDKTNEKINRSSVQRSLIQGYLAAISYADAQVGRLIDALDRSAFKDNTVIVLSGDHGLQMGVKDHWLKNTLWEESTKTPLLWVVPGVTKPGSRCQKTVELLSIYPTLLELAGAELPPHNEGRSLVSLLKNPAAKWDQAAISTMGFQNHAVRSEKWRYIRYSDGSDELYDHDKDPRESQNLASSKNFNAVKEEMARWLPKLNAPERKAAKAKLRGGAEG